MAAVLSIGSLRSWGHEKLSLEVLDNETKSRAFALVILKMLTDQGERSAGRG